MAVYVQIFLQCVTLPFHFLLFYAKILFSLWIMKLLKLKSAVFAANQEQSMWILNRYSTDCSSADVALVMFPVRTQCVTVHYGCLQSPVTQWGRISASVRSCCGADRPYTE